MPIYEYRCKICNNRFEELVGIKDKDRGVVCPVCNSRKLEKLLSSFNGGVSGQKKSDYFSSGCPGCSNPDEGNCPL